MAQYQVQDPTGEMHVIDGPEGATPDEVISQASSLIPKAPKSIGGFANNVLEDVKSTAGGIGTLAKNFVSHPIDTAVNTAEAIPGALVDEGKRIGVGELLTGHPINAVKKFGEAAYNKPVTTALDVLPAVEGAGKLLGVGGGVAKAAEVAGDIGKAGEAGDIVSDVSRIAPKAPAVADVGGEAADILKSTPTPPVEDPVPPTSGIADKIKGKIPKQVLDPIKEIGSYLENKYAKIPNKHGLAGTAADYLKQHSNNMTLKEMGAAPGQIRKIGVDKAHELAQYAKDNGLVGPKVGEIGRQDLVNQRLEDTGGAVGAFRQMATDRGALHNPQELINQIRTNLDKKYLTKGIYQGQKGSYLSGLEELKKTDGTAGAISDKVTEMFKEAKNQNPLSKPEGAFADIARQARQINHDKIGKFLSPQEMTLYEKSLEDYGALTQIKEFLKRRASIEAGGRLGPGSGISRMAVQKFLDSFGYRAQSKIADRLADFIRKNPNVMERPRDLFRHYIDEAAEAAHEMGDPYIHH